jgi:large subunit ribosomal protein L21
LGDKVDLDKVLLLAYEDEENKITIGNPTIEGAKVVATSEGPIKGKKIIVLRFKHKDHFTKKTGHRQKYSRLVINDIVAPGTSNN